MFWQVSHRRSHQDEEEGWLRPAGRVTPDTVLRGGGEDSSEVLLSLLAIFFSAY